MGRKGQFPRDVFLSVSVITTIVIKIMESMGLSSILSIIHTITIGTMLNFNSGNNGHGQKNVNRKQTFKVINQYYSTKPMLLDVSCTLCDVFILRTSMYCEYPLSRLSKVIILVWKSLRFSETKPASISVSQQHWSISDAVATHVVIEKS